MALSFAEDSDLIALSTSTSHIEARAARRRRRAVARTATELGLDAGRGRREQPEDEDDGRGGETKRGSGLSFCPSVCSSVLLSAVGMLCTLLPLITDVRSCRWLAARRIGYLN